MRGTRENEKERQVMREKKLSVKMFGGFSANYGDEILTFGRQRDSKFGQLFQILMTRPGQEFSKRDIAESLYGWEKVEDLNASLNNTIFRLRKYLDGSSLPPGNYLSLDAGILRFGGAVEMESDVGEFERLFREFREGKDKRIKAELSEKACELYQGEFLPQLSNEQWVIEKSRYYQKLYFAMMKYLFTFLRGEGDYRKIERLAARAADIYPYEGWENWRIDSLISLNRYQDAKTLYQKTAAHVQEMGGFLSKAQQAQFRKIGEKIRQPEGTEEDISKYLMEILPEQGAYECTLPGFLDCFHMLKRVIKRGMVQFSLLLCTILDGNGHPAENRENCEKQGKKLCASFQSHLRLGDIYAKYSENQYLLLCVGAKKEHVSEIGSRIDVDFRKRCGGRGGISCRLLDDGRGW